VITKYQLKPPTRAALDAVDGAKAGSLVKGLKTARQTNPLDPQYQFIGHTKDESASHTPLTHIGELSNKQRREVLLNLRKMNDLRISQAMRDQKLQTSASTLSLPRINQPTVQMLPDLKAVATLQSEQLKTILIAPNILEHANPSEAPQLSSNAGPSGQEKSPAADLGIHAPLAASSPQLKSRQLASKTGPSNVLPVIHRYSLITSNGWNLSSSLAGAPSELTGYVDLRDGNMNKREAPQDSIDSLHPRRVRLNSFKPFQPPGRSVRKERQTKHERMYRFIE